MGSGTGNTILPLYERFKESMDFYACDFSPNAIDLLNKQGICKRAFTKDLVKEEIEEVEANSLDFVTMIFMLSAIHPDEQQKVIKKLALKLKQGGHILFRDYGAYDLAMMRFIRKKKGLVDLGRMVF